MAIFLQAGAYELTFMLPWRFTNFGSSDKVAGAMLLVTVMLTLVTVYFSGYISDKIGRVHALCIVCIAIAVS